MPAGIESVSDAGEGGDTGSADRPDDRQNIGREAVSVQDLGGAPERGGPVSIRRIAQTLPLHLPLREGGPCALGYQPPLLLGQRG